jgi:hypothetical protein
VSLYREGVSSNSPFHQFLTLWKVYENACEVRGKWQEQHKRRPVKVEDETIPDAFAFGGYQGRTFDEVRQELNDPFRVALAHGGNIRGGGAPKTAASAEDLLSVTYAVPVVRHMSYVTLRTSGRPSTPQQAARDRRLSAAFRADITGADEPSSPYPTNKPFRALTVGFRRNFRPSSRH